MSNKFTKKVLKKSGFPNGDDRYGGWKHDSDSVQIISGPDANFASCASRVVDRIVPPFNDYRVIGGDALLSKRGQFVLVNNIISSDTARSADGFVVAVYQSRRTLVVDVARRVLNNVYSSAYINGHFVIIDASGHSHRPNPGMAVKKFSAIRDAMVERLNYLMLPSSCRYEGCGFYVIRTIPIPWLGINVYSVVGGDGAEFASDDEIIALDFKLKTMIEQQRDYIRKCNLILAQCGAPDTVIHRYDGYLELHIN